MAYKPKLTLLGVFLLATVSIMATNPTLKVYDVDVTINKQTHTLDVVLDLRLKDFKIARNSEVVYTPIVFSEDGKDSLELSSFTICGRSRYFLYVREGVFKSGHTSIYRAGSNGQAQIKESIPLQDWMLNNGTIEIRQEETTCCDAPKVIPGNSRWGHLAIARLHSPRQVFEQEFDYVYVPPMKDEPVTKSIEGKAFVTFVVDKTALNPSYMNNPAELKKITNSIDKVKADPDAIITEVHIRGYASPEGSYKNNVRLAQGRTETLANYVNSLYKFEQGIITTSYEPEDWAGLRSYVADSLNFALTDRQGMLAVIDGPLGHDDKDMALKTRYPKDYQVILKQIYPWLRHSDYTVRYSIKVFSDLADLLRLYSTNPTKLRGVDFYTIAQQYPTGSPQYLDVMRKAVEVYPDDPMLNINMANIYLQEGNFDAAQSCLLKAGRNPQADYARGVMAAKRGDYDEAEKWFGSAKEGGIKEAAQYLTMIKDSRDVNPVEILISTTSQKEK